MDSTAFLTEEDIVIHEFKGAPPRRLQRRLKKGGTGKSGKDGGGSKKGGIGPGKAGVKNGSTIKGIGVPKKSSGDKTASKTSGKNSKGKSKNSIPKTLKKPKTTVSKTNTGSDKVKKLKERMRAMAVKLMNRAKVCPKKHKLKQFSGEEDGYSCNLCSKYFDQVYGCRICDWDACEKCLKSRSNKNKDSSAGAASKKAKKTKKGGKKKKDEEEDDTCWDYRKGMCRKGSRCKWKHDDEQLENEMGDMWGEPLDNEMGNSWGSGNRGGWLSSTTRHGWRASADRFHPYSTLHDPYQDAFEKPINSALMRNSGYSVDDEMFDGGYSVDEEIFEGLYRRPVRRSVSGQGSVEALMFNSQHLAGPRMDEKMCWNFLEGSCRAGAKCKWSHEFPEDEIDKYIEKKIGCPVCSQMFIDYDGLEQHQEAKLHYPPETLAKIKEVMRKNKEKRKPRDENSKDHEWGDWEKHGTGVGSKLLKKWGFEDRLGKSKVGPINPVILDVRRKNTGLGFAGWKKRKRITDDPVLHQILKNGKKRRKEEAMNKEPKSELDSSFAQVPLDYSQLSGGEASESFSKPKAKGKKVKKASQKKWINNSKNKKGSKNKKSAGKKKRPAKGEKGFDTCWNFKKGSCKKGDKCKWKHS